MMHRGKRTVGSGAEGWVDGWVDGRGRRLAWLLVALLLTDPASALFGQDALLDIAGRIIGAPVIVGGTSIVGNHDAPGRPRLHPGGDVVVRGTLTEYPAGYYLHWSGPDHGDVITAISSTLFRDGTFDYLPLEEWDVGDIETGDINGDGLEDIIFSISRFFCDSIPGTRPRVWIQNAAHRFVDETDTRIPSVTTSTFDIDIFDADGDADLDILLGGYRCVAHLSPATLLINDGDGMFTDETAERLPAVPEFHFLYFSVPTLIDSDASPDIVSILINVNNPGGPESYPYIFLNTGDGHFWPDNRGRLLDYGEYGFFNVEAADLNGDGLEDLLFLNDGSASGGYVGGLALFLNAGDGFMVDETPARMTVDTLRRTRDVAIADVDEDGDLDVLDVGWLSADSLPQLKLWKNNGNGFFTAEIRGALMGLSGFFNDAEFAPFAGDSLPDLYLARVRVGEVDSDLLLLNHGDGVFEDSSNLLPIVFDFTSTAAVSDIDGDGDADIVLGNGDPIYNQTGQNRLYLNQRYSPPSDVVIPEGVPRRTSLLQNYPNPFNPSTVIRYALAEGAPVTITAVNVLGTVVLNADLGYRPPGTYEFRWDAGHLPGGVYVYSTAIGGIRVASRTALLIK